MQAAGHQIFDADEDNTGGDQGFDNLGRQSQYAQHAQCQCDRMGDRKSRNLPQQRSHCRAEQEQAYDKKDMVQSLRQDMGIPNREKIPGGLPECAHRRAFYRNDRAFLTILQPGRIDIFGVGWRANNTGPEVSAPLPGHACGPGWNFTRQDDDAFARKVQIPNRGNIQEHCFGPCHNTVKP